MPPTPPAEWMESFASFKKEVKRLGYYEPDTPHLLAQLLVHVLTAAAGAVVVLAAEPMPLRGLGFLVMIYGLSGIGCHSHTSSHYATASGKKLNEALTYFGYPFISGMAAHFWWHKHVALHHNHPNVHGVDDDLGHMPLMATTDRDLETVRGPMRLYYRYQWLLLPFGMGLIVFGMQFRSTVFLLRVMANGESRTRAHWIDLGCLFGHVVAFWMVPLLWFDLAAVATFNVLRTLCMGYAMFAILAPAHLPEEAIALEAPPKGADPVFRQVATTVNFRTGRLGRWVCSGLDFQIEHHLFRAVPHTRLPQLSGMVQSFCAFHGYPYATLGWGEGIWKAAWAFAEPKRVHVMEADHDEIGEAA